MQEGAKLACPLLGIPMAGIMLSNDKFTLGSHDAKAALAL